MLAKLTERQIIEKIQAADPAKKVTISCGEHLIVRVFNRNAYYYIRLTHASPVKIGRVGEMSIKEARQMVKTEYNRSLENSYKDKPNPSAPKPFTFQQYALRLLDIKKLTWYPATHRKYLFAYRQTASIYDVSLSDISNKLIKKLVLEYYEKTKAAHSCHLIFDFCCQVMNLAVVDEVIENHNLQLLKHSPYLPQKTVKGFRFIPLKDLKSCLTDEYFVKELHKLFVVMILFTCLRPGECCQIKNRDIDFKKKVIVLDGKVMKIKKEYFRIPLTDYMIDVIRYIQKNYYTSKSNYLFGADTETEALNLLKAVEHLLRKRKDPFHLHGMRKTARTWFAEHKISIEIAAKCLDHSLTFTGADRFYQKSDLLDQRRKVMNDWNKAVYEALPDDCQAIFQDRG